MHATNVKIPCEFPSIDTWGTEMRKTKRFKRLTLAFQIILTFMRNNNRRLESI